MSCTSPLRGYYKKGGGFTTSPSSAWLDRPLIVSCGRCMPCRIRYSRDWAIRCVHEAQLFNSNCFVTLTYNDASLPIGNTLVYRDVQLFLKKLRKKFRGFESIGYQGELINPIRFFMCGEYGPKSLRPHYHLLLFNFTPQDLELHSEKNGNSLYRSEVLSNLWNKGYVLVGGVSYQSAFYVARYVFKKFYGDDADAYYGDRLPEFIQSSRRPGIGYFWFQQFWRDCYPKDYLTVNGRKYSVPRYYDKLYALQDPDSMLSIKVNRAQQHSQLVVPSYDNYVATERDFNKYFNMYERDI